MKTFSLIRLVPRTRVALAVLTLLAATLSSHAPTQAEEIRIHLVWTNDIHGHVAPEGASFMNPAFPPPLGGAASASAYVEKLRAYAAERPNEAVILTDAGDTWQGAPIGTLTDGEVMEEYFDLMDYDVVVPGNHEFDKGKDVAIRMSSNMKQKMVCANIYEEGTDKCVDWLEPYRIVEEAGLRIGIIGATTPSTRDMAFAENIAGLDFGPVLPAVERWRDHLKNNENVDVVMLVVHEGLPFDPDFTWANLMKRKADGENLRENMYGAMQLAHVLEGVPIIVAGHTHRGYRHPWIDPLTHTMVLETFGNGSSLGHIILRFDAETKTLLGYESPRRDGVLVTMFEDEWWPEAEMQESLAPFIEEVRKGLDVVVGESRTEMTRRGGNNSPMGNFVTDAMRDAFEADMAFTNNGGLRTDLPPGKITVGNLMTLLPFGNSLVVVDMSGRTIRNIFDRKGSRNSSGLTQSGCVVVVDPDAPRNQRVLELTIGGQPIEPDKIYKVVTSDYLMEGNSGLDFLATIPPDQATYTMLLTRAAVTRYLEQQTPISPKRDNRWSERPAGDMASYLQGWDLP